MRYALNNCTCVEEFTPNHVYVFSGKCVMTGKPYSVKCPAEGMFKINQGALIQNAFPGMSLDDREFLISGISPEGWKETFPEEEESVDPLPVIIPETGREVRSAGDGVWEVQPFGQEYWLSFPSLEEAIKCGSPPVDDIVKGGFGSTGKAMKAPWKGKESNIPPMPDTYGHPEPKGGV